MTESKAPHTCTYSMSKPISEMYWRMLKVSSGSVLDVGCGRGGFGLAKPTTIDLYGVERDSAVAEMCANYEDVFVADVSNLTPDFLDGIDFSGVLARDILEHIDAPWNLLNLLYDRMRPGAVIICSVPKADPKVVWNDYTHVRGFTKHAISSLLENSGFEVIQVFPMSGYSLATKYKFASFLPVIAKIPLVGRLMNSWHCIAVKRVQ